MPKLSESNDRTLASGTELFPEVPYYGRRYIEPDIALPQTLPADKVKSKLKLRLTGKDSVLSENEYDLLLARKDWNSGKVLSCC